MISHLVCVLSFVIFFTLQTTIFSQTPLISGTADVILLFFAAWSLHEQVRNTWFWILIFGVLISLVSAMPYFAPLMGYVVVYGISMILQKQVWRNPILAMFLVTLIGSFFQQIIYVITLKVSGASIPWGMSFDHVIIPSLLLNLIFALPIYAIINDLVGRIYPLEVVS